MPSFGYVFPAIRGIQAGREYYVSMCPLRIIPRIFIFDEDEVKPELRAQRVLNKNRVPEITRYLVDNPKDYTFSSITASVDGEVRFKPLGAEDTERSIGELHIGMRAKFVINDGQHRRAAIEAALRDNPDLGDETISVVLFLDVGLGRCQQMFADLNRHAVRPTTSLGLLYDNRDEAAEIAKAVVGRVPVFADLTDKERAGFSNRSNKLFTLSGIYRGTRSLLLDRKGDSVEARTALAAEFWCEVAKHIADWNDAREKRVSPADLRHDYVHAHTLAIAALGRAGRGLLAAHPKDWQQRLAKLDTLDWSRANAGLWEGRAMNAGRLSKKTVNVTLVGNAIKRHLGLDLADEEQRLEEEYRRNHDGRLAQTV